jgi:hypothetical protein
MYGMNQLKYREIKCKGCGRAYIEYVKETKVIVSKSGAKYKKIWGQQLGNEHYCHLN